MRLWTLLISRRTCCGAILLFAAFPAAAQLMPGEEEVLTERMQGYADGVGLAARNAALENAKQEIIRKVLNAIVASGDLTHLRNVLRSASQYIRGHEMLRHDIVGDGTRVEIDAYVDTRPLYRDVAASMLPYLPEPPRILLVIGEQIGDDRIVAVPDFGHAETALRQPLEKLGLNVSGVDSITEEFSHPELVEIVTGDVERGAAFARGSAADVVLVGTAVTETLPPAAGANVARSRATVTVRIYRGVDGDLADAFTAVAAVSSLEAADGALQATQDACAKLVSDITVAAVLTVLGTRADERVVLTLERPGSLERVDAVIGELRVLVGSKRVEVMLRSETLARLRVDYAGPMLPFVEELTAPLYEGAELIVRHAVGREVIAFFE